MALSVIITVEQLKYPYCPLWAEWINKLVYFFNEILPRNENEQTNATHSNTDEFLKCGIDQKKPGNSLAVQGLGLRALTAEGPGSIPGWGTKIPQASQCGEKIKKKKKKKSQKVHTVWFHLHNFFPLFTYKSFEIRGHNSVMEKFGMCLPLERVLRGNTRGGLLGGVAIVSWCFLKGHVHSVKVFEQHTYDFCPDFSIYVLDFNKKLTLNSKSITPPL